MHLQGVSYDVGRVMDGNWRPVFDRKIVHRELEIIQNDLHCNAVRICGLDVDRLMTAARFALELGLTVWLSPEMWDQSPAKTLAYITRAAASAEELRGVFPGRIVLLVGSELTLFMQGIVPGRNVAQRMGKSRPLIQAGKHNAPLNAFLTRAASAVRQQFHGQITYASLVWEAVDWTFSILSPSTITGTPESGIGTLSCSSRPSRMANRSSSPNSAFAPTAPPRAPPRGWPAISSITPRHPRIIAAYLANAIRARLFGIQLPPPRMRLRQGDYIGTRARKRRRS